MTGPAFLMLINMKAVVVLFKGYHGKRRKINSTRAIQTCTMLGQPRYGSEIEVVR